MFQIWLFEEKIQNIIRTKKKLTHHDWERLNCNNQRDYGTRNRKKYINSFRKRIQLNIW